MDTNFNGLTFEGEEHPNTQTIMEVKNLALVLPLNGLEALE